MNTSLCYIERNGSYLMLHRTKKQNDENHDKWIGIGGKFEPCESPEDCVVREVREETGLELVRPEYRGIITFVLDGKFIEYMHLFYADNFSGSVMECDEGVLEWVRKSDMNSLPHWKGDEIFLELLDRKVPFFSLKLVYSGGILEQAVLNGENLPVSAA